MNKLQITMTTEQARIIKVALEEYFRAPLGQWHDLADRLAFRGFDWNNNTDEEFDKRCMKKAFAIYAFDAARKIANDGTGTLPRPTDEVIASDMWRILRHWLLAKETQQDIQMDTYHERDEPPIKVEELSGE